MNKEHVIVEAKSEYTKQLMRVLTEPVHEKMTSIYTRTEEATKNKRELLMNVQRELKQIPLWNQAQIDHEVDKVTRTCTWIGDLVAAIFISNVKILTSVKIGKDKKKIQITMPKTDQFIHKVYIETASRLYDNPFIFQAPNRKPEMLSVIKQSIEDTIRTMLPFQNILQSYLGNTLNSPSESESASEPDEPYEPHEPHEPHEPDEPHEPHEPVEPHEPHEPDNVANSGSTALDDPDQQHDDTKGFFDPPAEEIKSVQLNHTPGDKQVPRFFDDATHEEP